MRELVARIAAEGVQEVIAATNPTVEGDTTALYIARIVKPLGVRVTRLASGLLWAATSTTPMRSHSREGSGRPPRAVKVFLVSGYHTGSHRAWAEGYVAASRHDVHLVTLPGAFWKWRLTGGFVSLAERVEALAERVGPPVQFSPRRWSMSPVCGACSLRSVRFPLPSICTRTRSRIPRPDEPG